MILLINARKILNIVCIEIIATEHQYIVAHLSLIASFIIIKFKAVSVLLKAMINRA